MGGAAGTEAEQGSEGTAVPGEAAAAALEARLATLKEAVAGEQAAVAQERRQVQIAAANLASISRSAASKAPSWPGGGCLGG